MAKSEEEDIIEVSQKVLYLAQNFDRAFPGLENLKKTHFVSITQLLAFVKEKRKVKTTSANKF